MQDDVGNGCVGPGLTRKKIGKSSQNSPIVVLGWVSRKVVSVAIS